jgi:AAA+ ATPase superfamily predicted ATPase
MENPFAYSNYVVDQSFCNRQKEQEELLQYINASQNVLLYSHRRFGKSSLIQQVFKRIKKEKLSISTMYVELYGTTTEKDFIVKTFRNLNQIESNFDRLLKSIRKALKSIQLEINVDASSGDTTLSPSFKAVDESMVLDDLMNILKEYSKNRKLVIAFDEFQEIAKYSQESFEKRLRSHIQSHDNICYIFSGSQQHIITEMFNSNNRAFYKQASSFPIHTIETKHYVTWIKKLFGKKKIKLNTAFIEEIITRFENHPMYIQYFMFFLWEAVTDKGPDIELIDRIENSIIDNKNLEYITLWESLTINQKKTLKLVLLNDGSNLYNADALKSVDLKSASMVTKALSSLKTKEIIVKNGKYIIQDVLFKKWLSKITC